MADTDCEVTTADLTVLKEKRKAILNSKIRKTNKSNHYIYDILRDAVIIAEYNLLHECKIKLNNLDKKLLLCRKYVIWRQMKITN